MMDSLGKVGTTMKDTSNMTDKEREAHYQAESDAHMLSGAELVKNDPDRLKAATKMAGEMAEEKVEEARSMSKVADTLFDKTKSEEN